MGKVKKGDAGCSTGRSGGRVGVTVILTYPFDFEGNIYYGDVLG